jgi:hypothetical protein
MFGFGRDRFEERNRTNVLQFPVQKRQETAPEAAGDAARERLHADLAAALKSSHAPRAKAEEVMVDDLPRCRPFRIIDITACEGDTCVTRKVCKP